MKIKIFCGVICFCISVMCFGAESKDKGGILMDGVAARVNDRVVTVSEVLALVAPEHRRIAGKYRGDELKKRLEVSYSETLNALVERYLVLGAYEEQEGNLPDWVVDRRIDDIISSRFGNDRAKLMEALEADSLTFSEWRKQMLERIIVSTMNSANVMENAIVSPGQIRDEYEKNKEKYSVSEKVQLRLIVQAKDSEKSMDDLLKRLKAGEDFGKLAKEFSTGSEASDGGLWDWVEPKMLRSELVKAVNKLKEGEISPVIKTDSELYIVKLEKRKTAGVTPFAQAQAEIERNLRAQKAEQLYVAWIGRLKEKACVKLFDVELF